MDATELLEDGFSRIPEVARMVVDGLDANGLTWQPDPASNTIGWLVWHLTRVQDDHVAELAEREQVWVADAWAPRFGLPADTLETGYAHTADQVRAVRPDGVDALLDYLDAVTARTRTFLQAVGAEDLDRVIDASWDPPVTMGVRLVSVMDDGMQHVGQAGYVRGLHDRAVGSA